MLKDTAADRVKPGVAFSLSQITDLAIAQLAFDTDPRLAAELGTVASSIVV